MYDNDKELSAKKQDKELSSVERLSLYGLRIGAGLKGIIQSGFTLLLFGLILVIFSVVLDLNPDTSSSQEKSNPLINNLDNLAINTGVGFIAASLTILLVDFRTRKQNQQDLDNILNSIKKIDSQTRKQNQQDLDNILDSIKKIDSQTRKQNQQDLDNILDSIEQKIDSKIEALEEAEQNSIIYSQVSDKKIFNEIENHLLRKDFIIRNYEVEIQLRWSNQYHDFLIERNIVDYSIENISSERLSYPLRHLITNKEQSHQHSPKILEYKRNEKNSLQGIIKDNIQKQINEKSSEIVIEESVSIEKKSSEKVHIVSEVLRQANYEEPWVLSKIADGFQISVSERPDNLEVDCVPLHPLSILSPEEQAKYYDKPEKHGQSKQYTWTIKTGILPYQGLLVYWRKE